MSVTTKTVIFLRHAEATHNAAVPPGCCSKTELMILLDPKFKDAQLSTQGITQVAMAGKALRRILRPTLVWHSPLRRAEQTARAVFGGTSTILRPNDLLRERVTGRPCDDLVGETVRPPLEDHMDVRGRAARFLAQVHRTAHDVIAVVSHKRFLMEMGSLLAPTPANTKNTPGNAEGGLGPLFFRNCEYRVCDLMFHGTRVEVTPHAQNP